MRASFALTVFAAAAGCAHVTPSAPSVSSTPAVAVAAADSTPAHESFTITSRILGEARRINVHLPRGYSGSRAQYPVLYMPDGGVDEDFPHVARTVDSLTSLKLMRPVILAGIPNTQRRRDLTGPTTVHADSAIAPRVGGSSSFREFVASELIPLIEARYRTTSERGIIGESLAGLFIVETFLERPRLFAHYIALDPSVWWNNGAMIDSAPSLIDHLGNERRTFYFATSLEPGTSIGAARLAEMLKARAPSGLKWSYRPRKDLTHGNIFRSLKAEALVFSFN